MKTVDSVTSMPRRARNPELNRLVRLFRFLRQNQGWHHRDKIMHWTGFPSPKTQPICAYVEFANAVNRLNERIRPSGWVIARDSAASEHYALMEV